MENPYEMINQHLVNIEKILIEIRNARISGHGENLKTYGPPPMEDEEATQDDVVINKENVLIINGREIPMHPKGYLLKNMKEFCAYYHCGTRIMQQMINEGVIKTMRIGRNHLAYTNDIDAAFEKVQEEVIEKIETNK